MRFDVLTLFPEMFPGYLGQSLLKLAIEKSLVEVQLHNMRDWVTNKHKNIDHKPYGGGAGMLLQVEPVVECVEAIQEMTPEPGHLVLLTPQGQPLNQRKVESLATHRRLVLMCGRYEGFDQRVHDILQPEEISIGDFILNGGEVAAMLMIDTLIRLVPGVLGDATSSRYDSFSSGNRLLEYAQYTRPREYRGHQVPEVLLSGDHKRIAEWRAENSIQRTKQHRADLLNPADSSPFPEQT